MMIFVFFLLLCDNGLLRFQKEKSFSSEYIYEFFYRNYHNQKTHEGFASQRVLAKNDIPLDQIKIGLLCVENEQRSYWFEFRVNISLLWKDNYLFTAARRLLVHLPSRIWIIILINRKLLTTKLDNMLRLGRKPVFFWFETLITCFCFEKLIRRSFSQNFVESC